MTIPFWLFIIWIAYTAFVTVFGITLVIVFANFSPWPR